MEHNRLIKENIAPKGAKYIGVYKGTERVGLINLGTLEDTDSDTKLFSFGLLSDIHLCYDGDSNTDYPNNITNFKGALNFLNGKVDFVISCGDLIEGRSTTDNRISELNSYKTIREQFSNLPIYTILGNHENALSLLTESEWSTATGMTSGTTSVNGITLDLYMQTTFGTSTNNGKDGILKVSTNNWEYNFILFSPTNNDGPYGDLLSGYYPKETLSWLTSLIGNVTTDNKKAFIVTHVPLPTIGNYGYSYSPRRILNDTTTTEEKELTTIKGLIDTKPRCLWFMGHTHVSWEKLGVPYTNSTNAETLVKNGLIAPTETSKGDNYDANVWPCNGGTTTGGKCLHVPATFKGEFAIVDVYSNYVIIKGVQLIDSEYKYLPIAYYKITL